MSKKRFLRRCFNQFSAQHSKKASAGLFGFCATVQTMAAVGLVGTGAMAPGFNLVLAAGAAYYARLSYKEDRKNREVISIQANEQGDVRINFPEIDSGFNRYKVSMNQVYALFKSEDKSIKLKNKFGSASEISDRKRRRIEKALTREMQFRLDVLASKNVKLVSR